MIMYKIKNHLVIKVEVEEIEDGKAEWLGLDSDGDTIYKNTHFRTSVEAYKEALKINNIIIFKNGRKGKVIGRLEKGEYILETCKGGTID